MNTKILFSAAVITLGSLSMTGAYADTNNVSDATSGDSTHTQIDYKEKYNDETSSTTNAKDQIPTFTTADTDKDGYVTEKEFEAAKVDQKFDDVDTNSDGKVSEREMNNAVSMY